MHEYSAGAGGTRLGPIVLKYGSSLLVGDESELDGAHIARIAAAVATADRDVVIVSSGAVAAGLAGLGRRDPPARRDLRRAAAAIGQRRLMSIWGDAFAAAGREVGQVLLTNDCLAHREKYVAASETLRSLLRAGIVPVVNENDAVTAGDAVVGDNDNLAAVTAALVRADLLALFTDVPGVFDSDPVADPSARVIAHAESAAALRSRCFAKKVGVSVGGMETKLEAAEHAGRLGIPTMIASGTDAEALGAALTNQKAGTWIAASSRPLKARRHWMAQRKGLAGTLVVDAGAVRALQRRASLLPSGVTAVHGRFRRGDVVAVVDDLGVECARGIVRFDDRDVERIRGLHTIEVERILGPGCGSVVMRPDRMVLSAGEVR